MPVSTSILSDQLPACLPACPSVCLPVAPSIYLTSSLSVFLPVPPSAAPDVACPVGVYRVQVAVDEVTDLAGKLDAGRAAAYHDHMQQPVPLLARNACKACTKNTKAALGHAGPHSAKYTQQLSTAWGTRSMYIFKNSQKYILKMSETFSGKVEGQMTTLRKATRKIRGPLNRVRNMDRYLQGGRRGIQHHYTCRQISNDTCSRHYPTCQTAL
jgi:hypothetical protein